MLKQFFLLIVAIGLPCASMAEPPIPSKEKMLADLDIIKSSFEIRYAPAQWKKTYTGWNLEEQINQAKTKVIETDSLTLKDFHHILLEFFNSAKDYHVGIQFFSTEAAFLPFRIHSTNGKYFIAWVYSPMFSGLKNPLQKGDEVLFINGRPVDAVVQELKKEILGNSDSATDQALAEMALTIRLGSQGHRVPQGNLTMTVRSAGSKKNVAYRLNWLYNPEEIPGMFSPLLAAQQAKLLSSNGLDYFLAERGKKRPLGTYSFFHKEMSTPLYKTYKEGLRQRKRVFDQALETEEEDYFIGSKKSFLPLLGNVIWSAQEESDFDAYIYLNSKGKKIGYVRIPHYSSGAYSSQKFSEILSYLQANTELLVIDQMNNPGGSVFYMYALASMLSDKPMSVPKHQMTITQEDVAFALEWEQQLAEITNDEEAVELIGATLGGYPVDFQVAQAILRYSRFVIQEWSEGRDLTQAEYLYGIDQIQPYPGVQYTKPILVLVNALDFSCGDFFPAILQDNKRATIMGTRTAGAGGYVMGHIYPNRFGIAEYSFTGSLAQRVDLNPIENLGVTPDRWMGLTEKDLEMGYSDFVEQVNQAVNEIVP